MSYDFTFLKIVGKARRVDELTEEMNRPLGSLADIKQGLTQLIPGIVWEQTGGDAWWGSVDGEDTWYEFLLRDSPVPGLSDTPIVGLSVRTSHRAPSRKLIAEVCRFFDFVAVDGQKLELVTAEDRHIR